MSNIKANLKLTYTFSINKLIKDDSGSKKPVGMPLWKSFNKPEDCIIKPNDKVLCVMTGKKNNITVIDCDTHQAYHNLVSEYPILNNTYTVKTSKGFHIYCKYDEKAKTTTNQTLKIDVRNDGGIVFGAGSKTEFNTEYTVDKDLPLVTAPIEVWSKLCLRKATNINKDEPPRVNKISSDIEIPALCRDILENIDILFWTDYDDWIRLVWAIKNHFGDAGYKIAKEFSQKCDNFGDGSKFKEVWATGESGNSWGTIEYYSKLSNPEQHLKIKLIHKPIKPSVLDMEVAECLLELIGDEVFLKEGEWYMYDNDYELWVLMQCSDDWLKFNNLIYQTAKQSYTLQVKLETEKLNNELSQEQFEKKNKLISEYHVIIKEIGKIAKIKTIAECVKMKLACKKVDVEMDRNPYLFCFLNETIDLKTGNKYTRNKYDYLSLSCGYYYNKPKKSEYDKVCDIINKIFPNPEIKKCYASILFSALTGVRPERFIICNGAGRNGKGLINELLGEVVGGENGYYNKGSTTTLTKDLAQGANPAVANMHMKRVVISSEPEKGQGLNVENIKKLTGDNQINARKLYSSNCMTKLTATQIMEANDIPKIDGTIGQAEISRFIIVPFDSLFLGDVKEPEINDNNVGNKYPVEQSLKFDSFKRTHKQALFEWILNNATKDIYVPDVVKNATEKYLLSCDDIVSFLDDVIEYTEYDINDVDKQDFVNSKELFELYKESEAYVNKNKAEKRKYNQSAFKNDLRTNQKFAKHYKEHCMTKGKARDKRSILLGWRLKEEDECEEDPTM